MDLMVNPVITKFAQKVDGEITELKLGAKQEDAYAQIYAKGAESGGGKVENNKTATINVSTYTEPVEITPTSGKTSMKKATVTLSNIPSSQTAYGWVDDTNDVIFYFQFDKAPDELTTGDRVLYINPDTSLILIDSVGFTFGTQTYTKISDSSFTYGTREFSRVTDGPANFTLWEINVPH